MNEICRFHFDICLTKFNWKRYKQAQNAEYAKTLPITMGHYDLLGFGAPLSCQFHAKIGECVALSRKRATILLLFDLHRF
jgi:hypothetical protein